MWSRSLRNKKKEEGFTGAQQVYDCALDLLSYRDYSHKDMVERLQRKGATKAQALEAVAKLEDYGLLNEERYAQRVYEAWLGKRYLWQLVAFHQDMCTLYWVNCIFQTIYSG